MSSHLRGSKGSAVRCKGVNALARTMEEKRAEAKLARIPLILLRSNPSELYLHLSLSPSSIGFSSVSGATFAICAAVGRKQSAQLREARPASRFSPANTIQGNGSFQDWLVVGLLAATAIRGMIRVKSNKCYGAAIIITIIMIITRAKSGR